MYANPHEIVARVCKSCGNVFNSPRYYNKEYCSVTCRRRFKAQRAIARERESGIITKEAEKAFDDRFFVVINNPSTTELDKYAELMLDNLNRGKPIKLTGTIPFWTPPQNIVLVQQQGVEPAEFLMVMRDENPLDALLQPKLET